MTYTIKSKKLCKMVNARMNEKKNQRLTSSSRTNTEANLIAVISD